ncbi:dockerin type I repeat-containing protein [Paenibacillus polysaccharolyticus]|uniref:dockerin type I repeat-containing protein n=1 Tax=Paenibacillus polysaccharolyticus TaxID=582692 RepID=UPI00203F3281|nr:dockerin type I repeat-containing protein [Paenibacillus polysaccharolyticus]MCM3132314.1 dockerin type I repeat-containing protein [Paenibacillus polysaccharolyticus]
MKGKNKRNTLKPIMKKSMLAVLGLGIALPVAGSLPQIQAGAIGPTFEISRPVLNEGISWMSVSSTPSNSSSPWPSRVTAPITVEENNFITIDLSNHFPSDKFSFISAQSSNNDIASADVSQSQDHSKYTLVVVPFAKGMINIKLTAQYKASQDPNVQLETIEDNIELYISKKGDFNNDGYVDSADAVELLSYLRTRSFLSNRAINRADIDRNGTPELAKDMKAFMQGYIEGSLGAKNNSYVLTFKQVDDAPYAFNGKLNGTMQLGQTITGTFAQLDVDEDYAAPAKYQWYTATDVNGTDELAIEQPNSAQYTIQNADVGRYLILKITPVSNSSQSPEGKTIVIRGMQAMEGPPPPP